jgi:hypothetical protein
MTCTDGTVQEPAPTTDEHRPRSPAPRRRDTEGLDASTSARRAAS